MRNRNGNLQSDLQTRAHRGYLIQINPLNGLIWIERDQVKVGYAPSVDAARATIDSLIDWAPVDPAKPAVDGATGQDDDRSWAPVNPGKEVD